MSTDGRPVTVQKVEPSSNPVQDEDLDQYGEELAGLTIVDVDVHVDDTLMYMLDYMEGHFRKRMETVLQADFQGRARQLPAQHDCPHRLARLIL